MKKTITLLLAALVLAALNGTGVLKQMQGQLEG